MGKAYRLVRPTLTATDVVRIRGDNNLSLTTSPFGVTPEQYENSPPIYIKKAAPWKGYKGLGIGGFERAVMNLGLPGGDTAARNLVEGLKKAIAISKSCAGIKGTELYNGKLYPRKCIEQKRKAGKL